MFNYMMIPLDQHSDGGAGAIGESFERAANMLFDAGESRRFTNMHLPVNFLYRHAIELFLKSMITVLHRSLKLPYGDEPFDATPMVLVDDKWRPLHKEHRIRPLWHHVTEVMRANQATLTARCNTRWLEGMEELRLAIEVADEADPTSTFFRYTDPRTPEADRAKSSWKTTEVSEILTQMQMGAEPVKAFFLEGRDGRLSGVFREDARTFDEVTQQFAELARSLSGAHSGLRVELANGL